MSITSRISVFDSFEAAESDWREIERIGECFVFQSFDWASNWFRFIGRRKNLKPCITLLRTAQGEPVLLLPLAIEERVTRRALVWIGGTLSDYLCPILGPGWEKSEYSTDFAATWQSIRELLPDHDLISFDKQPAMLGESPNPFASLHNRLHPSEAHYAFLGASLDQYLRQRRSPRSLQTHRRKERRLAENGELEFVIARSDEGISAYLDTLFEQKRHSYRDLGVADVLSEPGCTDFIRYMTSRYPDTIRLFALKLEGTTLSVLWGATFRNRFYHLFPSYARDRNSVYSPGNILLIRVFRWCIENGVDTYDFTVGDEEYKRHWCEHDLTLYDHVDPVTARGVPSALGLSAHASLKRLIKKSPRMTAFARQLRAKARLANWPTNPG